MRLDCKLAFGLANAAFVAFFAVGCSGDSGSVAGNSAETGSPELASLATVSGSLYLDDGKPAALARVVCVPSEFNVYDDTIYISGKTDVNGDYELKDVKPGDYSLEAYSEESGERLLVQGLTVADSDSCVTVSDTLEHIGYALLRTNFVLENGGTGVVTSLGSTIYRDITVENGSILVDSLPAGRLNLTLTLNVGDSTRTVYFNDVLITPGDTAFVVDTLVVRFVAPLALPEGVNDSAAAYVSDIPLALRLTTDNCDFDTLSGMTGRWEVQRLSANGGASKKLPIVGGYFDTLAQEAVFWVNIDSLNLGDSLQLSFDNTMNPAFARDVFPTNRSYALVWHFDDGLSPVTDGAEKQLSPGTATLASTIDGAVGSGVRLESDGYITVDVEDTDSSKSLFYELNENFCFSIWVRLDNLDSAQTIFEKGENGYRLRYVPERGFVVEFFHVATGDTATADTASYEVSWESGDSLVTAGEWTYVSFGKKNANMSMMHVNDVFVNPAGVKCSWDGTRDTTTAFKVGGFDGAIDELMLGGCYRDDSWDLYSYLNQKNTDFWPALKPRE